MTRVGNLKLWAGPSSTLLVLLALAWGVQSTRPDASAVAPPKEGDDHNEPSEFFKDTKERAKKLDDGLEAMQKMTQDTSNNAKQVQQHLGSFKSSVEGLQKELGELKKEQKAYSGAIVEHFINSEEARMKAFKAETIKP